MLFRSAAAVATPQAAMAKSKTTQWNTKNLGLRLGADLVSAASAAVLVAPIISIIDRYVFSPSTLPRMAMGKPQKQNST